MNPQTASAAAHGTVEVPWDRIEKFVGQLTHDVRNGLNALELQLTFLGEISTDPEAIEEVKSLRKTVAAITSQLQSVRAAVDSVVLNKLDYPASDFFEDLRERFERRESASKCRVQWRTEPGTGLLSIDPETSMVALLELIANALYFSESNASIKFDATMTGDEISVRVEGPCALPPTAPTSRWGLTPLVSTRRGAYGLGLFRVRRIIEAQGGRYEAAYSEADRLLSTTVTLPISRLP